MTLVRTLPQVPSPDTSDIRVIVNAIRNIFQRRLDAAGEITLTVSVASTAVTDNRVGTNSAVVIVPMTASAAAEVGNGTIYVSTVASGSFTLTHANNATADRTFRYIVMG